MSTSQRSKKRKLECGAQSKDTFKTLKAVAVDGSPSLQSRETSSPSVDEDQDSTCVSRAEAADSKQIFLRCITRLFERWVEHNHSNQTAILEGPFVGPTVPNLAFHLYVERLGKHIHFSDPQLYIVAVVYLDRYLQQQNQVSINVFTAHRLLLLCLVVTVKFWEDDHYSNKDYAMIGGVGTEELNQMEVEVLFGLEFEMSVTLSSLQQAKTKLLQFDLT
mmetsp:Transcript_25988/g.36848  ORF Transcript_25988/g.36848 Transcript_25988/m.36848 type:complete len:219 (-) Transcript_25988:1364-2020(-)